MHGPGRCPSRPSLRSGTSEPVNLSNPDLILRSPSEARASRRMAASPNLLPWFETARCARLLTMRPRGAVCASNRHWSARALAFLPVTPLHELLEQSVAVALRNRRTGGWRSAQECLEFAADILLRRHFAAIEPLQLLLRDGKSGPALDRGRQVDVPPFRMVRRLQQLVPVGEQPLNETLNLAIALML